MSIFEIKANKDRRLFFGDSVDVIRYDNIKFPFIHGLNEQQIGYFWRPQEVDNYRDRADHKSMSPAGQHIVLYNLCRQILLDSIQERAMGEMFASLASTPEMENWITTWPFFEQIHNRTYQYILEGVYVDPSVVFDKITELEPIMACAEDIVKYYDDLITWNARRALFKVGEYDGYDEYQHKRSFLKAIVAVMALEGIRFYASFACSWAMAEQGLMQGNATLIKFICRDENLHLGATQHIIKNLFKTDPDFVKIREEEPNLMSDIVAEVAAQEIDWAAVLFEQGSVLGLNEYLVVEFVKWRTNRVLQGAGMTKLFPEAKANPLPWTQRWISSEAVQDAPQEIEKSSYEVGAVLQDVTPEALGQLDF